MSKRKNEDEPPHPAKRAKTGGQRIGFVGCGNMAVAMVRGFLAGGLSAENISISNRTPPAMKQLEDTGVTTTTDNKAVVGKSDTVFLCVKPWVIKPVLEEVASIAEGKLFVSVAAGVTIETMESLLPAGARVVRVMPNTPCTVGACAAGFALGTHATAADAAHVEELLGLIGTACAVTEANLDAVTGTSGSGPAYVFMMIEALADGGVRAGLPRAVAAKLAAQTVYGAAKMVVETGKHPAALKDAVASPGGTTIHGIHALEEGKFRGTVINAVVASANRANALGKPASK